MTVADLMEDRVALDGVLLKCNQNLAKSRNDNDCLNARIAVERLAQEKEDPSLEQKHQEEFERSRERLRRVQEKQREAEEAKKKVNAYSLPVIPDPTATPPPANKGDSPPVAVTH